MSGYRVVVYSGTDPALNPYKAMVYSDWMKSLRFGNEWFKLIDSNRFYSIYGAIIRQILAKPECHVRLAVLSDEPDTCLGWTLSEGNTLHYAFVKKDLRRQGIGKALLPKSFDRTTHLTKIGQAIRQAKFRDLTFDPFLT